MSKKCGVSFRLYAEPEGPTRTCVLPAEHQTANGEPTAHADRYDVWAEELIHSVRVIDSWTDEAKGTYDVNVHEGWIIVEQGDEWNTSKASKDVIAAIAPEDARRLAKALIRAARMADKHPRWKE